MVDLTNKNKAYLFLGLFTIIAFVFWKFSDQFAAWSMTQNPFLVILVSIIINPAYIFLIYTLYKQYNLRGLLAGILISISIDIVSLGHSIPLSGTLPTDPVLYTYADTTLFKLMSPIIHGPSGVFVFYVVVSSAIVYLAFRIIRRTSSFNKIIKESI